MPSGGNKRSTQYIYSQGTDEVTSVYWAVVIGNNLIPSALTKPTEIEGTLDSNFIFPVVPTYIFSPGSITTFTTTETWAINFVPSYIALVTRTAANTINSILAIRAYSTPLVSGQTKTITFSFSGVPL